MRQRAILVACGSVFLALMLVILQLKYMRWQHELKLRYDEIKRELIIKSSVDSKKDKSIGNKLIKQRNNF